MLTKSTRERLLASTIILGASLAMSVGSAQAQNEPATHTGTGAETPVMGTSEALAGTPQANRNANTGATAARVDEVVVTGSRIASPNLRSNSPITIVNSQEVKLQGVSNIETLINNLPSVLPDQNSSISNGSTGTANINLRSLGPQRTLVLINGRRLNPGDVQSFPAPSPADVNFVPAALVDRIDLVTGGASAVYGSDAVAGVVNFIMKKNFQGIQFDTQYSFYNHTNNNKYAQRALSETANLTTPKAPDDVDADGGITTVSAIIGSNSPDGKGNVTAYATYTNLQPVLQGTRDFSTCGLSGGGGGLACAGGSNTPFGRFGSRVNNPDGTNSFVRYSGALYGYDFAPANYLQRNDDRYTAGFFGHYKLNDHIEVYSDFMFMDDHTDAQIAASGLFRGTGPNGKTVFQLNCNNPFLGPTQVAALCPGVVPTPGAAGGTVVNLPLVGYRFAGSPRIDDLRHTDYRFDIGMRGDIAPGWSYDAYLQYGTTIYSENYQNDVSDTRVQDALFVVNDANGNPICASTVAGTSRGCVPLNIFRANGAGFLPGALNYVLSPGFKEGQAIEQVASVNVTGDLGRYGLKSPLANDGVAVALGSEYRSEQLDLKTDQEFQSGDLAGQGGATLPAKGSYDVYELFGEVRVPLIQDRPFIRDLSVSAGYRFSDYSSVGTTNTYKGEVSYSPFQDLRLRASYNHAVRAPTTEELFGPSNVILEGGVADPCAGANITGPEIRAACLASGVTPAQFDNGTIEDCTLNQCSRLVAGNPNLEAETSDSYTAGFVVQPRIIPNLSLSLDFFQIKVNHVISQGIAVGNTVLTECLAGLSAYCGLIHRDPTTGAIFGSNGYVVETNVNGGFLRTNGFDVSASYRTRFADWGLGLPDYGSLSFSFVGTYTAEFTTEPAAGAFFIGTYDCAGRFGSTCGTPLPHFKSQLRTTWQTPWNMQVSLNWRYIGPVTQDNYSGQPLLNNPGNQEPESARINSWNLFDVAMTYRFRDRYTFRAGINNIADKDPPIFGQDFGGFTNANTYPGVYDSLGRTIFFGLTADF